MRCSRHPCCMCRLYLSIQLHCSVATPANALRKSISVTMWRWVHMCFTRCNREIPSCLPSCLLCLATQGRLAQSVLCISHERGDCVGHYELSELGRVGLPRCWRSSLEMGCCTDQAAWTCIAMPMSIRLRPCGRRDAAHGLTLLVRASSTYTVNEHAIGG